MLTFTYKKKIYQIDKSTYDESCPIESSEFHYEQFLYLIEKCDWISLENRIINQLLHGGLIEL